MPRALRLEAENGSYHVINRGNYRAPLFASADAKRAFLRCLAETCQKTGWLLHAWALMSNHFHIAVTTPLANLAVGMQWLQGTFAIRFNRYRAERGHLFQGRFKSIAIEDGGPLGSVCHYINLNPVRAGLCSAANLGTYPWSSLAWILRPKFRPAWFDPSPALRHAGSLADSAEGHRKYAEYLSWLAEDEPEQKRQKFDRMSRGWAVGTADFTRSVIEEHCALRATNSRHFADMRFEYEAQWHAELLRLLQRLHRTPADLATAGKSAEWKVAIAAALKTRTTVTNPWLGANLHLGNRHEIGRKVAAWRRSGNPALARKLGVCPTPHNPTP